ncbi:sulfate adenylyltransferase, putative [Babesia ovata]|uniref:Sulfate adenylyltransferase, putative n=1 Tax=Babesia ovata TaxID=189622 RepID=A0A2H6KHQ1_9APIC|nr:sulfate adenylyltransferase, putative [Babesia ovata]GBE62527.1 sulfate adenylyltransferase, putative [Babesia ovata]
MEIVIDMSHIKNIDSRDENVSPKRAVSLLTDKAAKSSVVSKTGLQVALSSNSMGEVNVGDTCVPHEYMRSIYLLVPSKLDYALRFEEYAAYRASDNSVIYDVNFLSTHFGTQSEGKLRRTIHMTMAIAFIGSGRSRVELCGASEAAQVFPEGRDPATASTMTPVDDATDCFDLENTDAREPPEYESEEDLLDLSDIQIYDKDCVGDDSFNEFQAMMNDILPPTLDPEASTVADGIPDMDYSAFGDSCVEGDASEAPIFYTEMNEGLYSPGTIYDETYPDDETYAEDATMEENGSGSGQQLDLSDILIYDDEEDVSSGEFRSLISDLTPTFDQLALPVDHTFAEMEGNAFRG